MNIKNKIISVIISFAAIMAIGAGTVNASYTHFPPKGYGSLHTYTVWDKIKWGYSCGDLKKYGNSNNLISDSYGIVKYGDYFAGAITSTLGQVGDLLIVVEEGGVIYPVIIQDTKNQGDAGCNI